MLGIVLNLTALSLLMVFYFEQRKQTAKVNGMLSLLPGQVVKASKKMLKDMLRIAEIDNNLTWKLW